MLTRSAKNKGARLQKWVAKKISELLNIPYGRDECIRSREMGQQGVDVVLVGPALKMFPYSIECKNCEQYSMRSWIKQAKENILPDTDWLLITKRNYEEPLVIMDAETFFKLLKKQKEG